MLSIRGSTFRLCSDSAAGGQENVSVIELLGTVLLEDIYFNKHKVVMLA